MRSDTFVSLGLVFTSVGAYIFPHLTGHDFDFTATYRSGLRLSTSDPPTEVLSATEIALLQPVIALDDADVAGRDARYITFLEISYYPTIDILDDVIYTFSWIKTEQVVLENGTLSSDPDDSRRIYHDDPIESGEVRNATMHVWKQTDELMTYLTTDEMPILWQLATVWANVSRKAPKDFSRANIDFKTRNETGTCRGDVDANGATITGFTETATATACSATTTSSILPTTTGTDASATTTSSVVADPTESPNASAPRLITSPIWSPIISCILLVYLALLAI